MVFSDLRISSRRLGESGFSIVESIITMALVCMVAAFVFPIFSKMTGLSKSSNFKEHCQRLVSSKIAFYNNLTRDQLIQRYNQYRVSSPITGGGGVGTTAGAPTTALCGTLVSGGLGTTPEPLFPAKISSFIEEGGIYKYGRPAELGLRECVELSDYPMYDVQRIEVPGKPYPPNFCLKLNGGGFRKSDEETSIQLPGTKVYVRMRLLGDPGSQASWTCPANLEPFQSYLNQSLEIQVSAVSDYLSVGNSSTGGVVDPNALMCSARTSISMMKERGPLAFRYFAAQTGSPLRWSIHRVSDGWKTHAPVYAALSELMNATTVHLSDGATLSQSGVVTQFGVSPRGDLGYVVKAFENDPDPNFPLTSVLCVLSNLTETGSPSSPQAFCRMLPRMPGNQIESILVDWKKGKMWGVSGRSANPNRGLSTPIHQKIDSGYLLADCSGTQASERERALFYGTPTCIPSDTSSGMAAMPTPVPVGAGDTITDSSFENERRLDEGFLKESLSTIYSPTVAPHPGAPSKVNHLDARSLRYLREMFSSTNGALFTVSSSPQRSCGPVGRCMSRAHARLFFSPDALTSYALMRYPGVSTESGCNSSQSGMQVSIFRLEFPLAAGSSNQMETTCPEMVLNLQIGSPGVEVLPELLSY